jgi:selenocysteine lyase/cysteine desulfurase
MAISSLYKMIPCQRHLFDIPEGITYLNCAYMSPLMHSVVEAGRTGLERKLHPWQIKVEDFFDQADDLRGLAAKLFHCTADDIALVPSASYGLSTAALNLPLQRGQRILVLDEQFPSNFYPWQRLAQDKGAALITVAWPEDNDWTAAVLRELTDSVAIAALPHVQWTSGGLLDLEKIGEACRRNGTALVLDLTQSLGAYPVDVRKVLPDFAVAAGYKWLLGPYATGVMYVAPKWQQAGRPLEENWILRDNARDFSGLILYSDGYEPGARRFDMGERSNFALVPAVVKAIEQILEWGVEEISKAIGALNGRLLESAEDLGMTAPPEPLRAPHYLCLRSGERPSLQLVETFANERVHVSLRSSSIRVTPHVYNSEEDIDRLVHVLKETVGRAQTSVR